MMPFTLNIRGQLVEYAQPAVMGILNVTPDSFYSSSRAQNEIDVRQRVLTMIEEGADFIDIGAYSARPGCAEVSEAEELRRLEFGLNALRKVAPEAYVSVDTFRASVARKAVKELGADIVNDISGGTLDDDMTATISDLHVPYILMHMRGTLATMHQLTEYDNLLVDVISELGHRLAQLNLAGACDVIIDPGFGFSKTLEQNYILLKNLNLFNVFHSPILVGISRKSMVSKLLNVEPNEALNGTVALNMAALQRGASILRVHDVRAAVQAVEIYQKLI